MRPNIMTSSAQAPVGTNAWHPEGPGASYFTPARPARHACDATGSHLADRCHALVGNHKPQGDIHRSGPR